MNDLIFLYIPTTFYIFSLGNMFQDNSTTLSKSVSLMVNIL